MPLTEKVLIVSLAVSTSRSVTRMKKEPSVAELESGRVVPRLDSSTKRGWLISTAHCSSHPGRSPGQPHRAASSLGKCRLRSLRSTVQYLLREITYLYTFWLRDLHATSIQGQAICFCWDRPRVRQDAAVSFLNFHIRESFILII